MKALNKRVFISQFMFFTLPCRSIVEEAMQCKKKILQNDGVVTSPCARPRKAGHTLLILGGQTFMCDKIYQVKDSPLYSEDLVSYVTRYFMCCMKYKMSWLGLNYTCNHPLINVNKWEILAQLVECTLTGQFIILNAAA